MQFVINPLGRLARLSRLALLLALLLSACSQQPDPTAQEPAPTLEGGERPATTATVPPVLTATPPLVPTEGPTAAPPLVPTEGPGSAPPEPTATVNSLPESLPLLEGEVILRLQPGPGPGQIGIKTDDANKNQPFVGPRSFRIGANGSIRILDNQNRRLLIFGQDGALQGMVSLEEALNPADFIINPLGEIFVFDQHALNPESGEVEPAEVLRYAPNGRLSQRLPLHNDLWEANSMMLTGDQDLMLIQDDVAYWPIILNGAVVPPEAQLLIKKPGLVSPRSTWIFYQQQSQGPEIPIRLVNPRSDSSPLDFSVAPPKETPYFFNLDRERSLYFRSGPNGPGISLSKLGPDRSYAGGGRIETGGCRLPLRHIYIDQAGYAWTLCNTTEGTTVTRYTLLDPQGQPLPPASMEPANVMWRPASEFNAA